MATAIGTTPLARWAPPGLVVAGAARAEAGVAKAVKAVKAVKGVKVAREAVGEAGATRGRDRDKVRGKAKDRTRVRAEHKVRRHQGRRHRVDSALAARPCATGRAST